MSPQGIPHFFFIGIFMEFIISTHELTQWRDCLKHYLRHSKIWINIANPVHYHLYQELFAFVYK